MDVFALRDQVVDDYRRYVTSFMVLRDRRVRERVDAALAEGRLWPEPRIGLNPAFASGGSVEELVTEGLLHRVCADIFRSGKKVGSAERGESLRVHRHESDAIRQARAGNHFVLTTGTGSGKSLGYMVPIVDHIQRVGSGGSVKAIVVYPINAVANSQHNDLEKFIVAGFPAGSPPVRFARWCKRRRDCGSWCWTSSTHTVVARARTSPSWCAASGRRVTPRSCAASGRRPPCPPRGPSRSSADR